MQTALYNTLSGMSLHHCWPEYFCMARFNLYVIKDNTLSQIFEKHPRGGGLGTYVGATRPALAPPSIRCCCRGCRACRALSGVGTVGTVGTVGVSLTVHAHGGSVPRSHARVPGVKMCGHLKRTRPRVRAVVRAVVRAIVRARVRAGRGRWGGPMQAWH